MGDHRPRQEAGADHDRASATQFVDPARPSPQHRSVDDQYAQGLDVDDPRCDHEAVDDQAGCADHLQAGQADDHGQASGDDRTDPASDDEAAHPIDDPADDSATDHDPADDRPANDDPAVANDSTSVDPAPIHGAADVGAVR